LKEILIFIRTGLSTVRLIFGSSNKYKFLILAQPIFGLRLKYIIFKPLKRLILRITKKDEKMAEVKLFVLYPYTTERINLNGALLMKPIKVMAELLFDVCETGKGWEVSRQYCRAGVALSIPDYHMKRVPSFLIATIALLIACWLPALVTPSFAQHSSPPAFWPEVSPDGSKVLFLSPSRSGPIYVMNADGSESHRVAEGTRPSWFPDGRRIVAVIRSKAVEQLVEMNIDGTDPDTLPTAYPHYIWRPRVSPDGRTIVVGNYWPTDDPNVFHIVRIDGTPVRAIHPSAPGELVEATWSHDGRLAFVAFLHDTASDWPVSTKLYVINGDGSGQRAIAMLPDAAQWISWSPDDREIAMQDEGKNGDGNILIVDVTTGVVRRITHHDHPFLDETPSWSPDGWIYFQSNRIGGYAIYRMHTDGSDQERLTR
jgi:hypothetical protein